MLTHDNLVYSARRLAAALRVKVLSIDDTDCNEPSVMEVVQYYVSLLQGSIISAMYSYHVNEEFHRIYMGLDPSRTELMR